MQYGDLCETTRPKQSLTMQDFTIGGCAAYFCTRTITTIYLYLPHSFTLRSLPPNRISLFTDCLWSCDFSYKKNCILSKLANFCGFPFSVNLTLLECLNKKRLKIGKLKIQKKVVGTKKDNKGRVQQTSQSRITVVTLN